MRLLLGKFDFFAITHNENKLDFEQESDGEWYYEQNTLGFNYRMSDIQAALGLSQLQHLDNYISLRKIQASRYNDLFANTDLGLPAISGRSDSSWHLYIIRLSNQFSKIEHRRVFNSLRARGINVALHYIPVYRHPYYRRLNISWMSQFDGAERYHSSAISLPIFPSLHVDQLEYVAQALIESVEVKDV